MQTRPNTPEKEKCLKVYKSKILAVRNYESTKDYFVADDFINENMLVEIIDEISTGESDITPAGKSFIEDYYGFENIAKMFNDADISLFIPKETLRKGKVAAYTWWFKNIEPMELAIFIAQSQGLEASKGTPLKEEFLPPEDRPHKLG